MIKALKLLSTAAISAITFTGCAVDLVPKYQSSDSYARNAVYMGGYLKVKDRTAPKGGIGSFTQTAEFGAVYTAAGFAAPALNLSNLASGGVNLLDMLIDDGPVEARNTTFGWMPISAAQNKEDAQEKMVSHVQLAMEKTFKKMKLDYSKIESDDPTFLGFYVQNESLGCSKDIKWEKWHSDYFFHPVRTQACIVRASIHTPRIETTPSAKITNNNEEKSYQFVAGSKKTFNAIQVFSPEGSSLPENQVYLEISKNLPEWMFIYLAPGKVALADGKFIGFPYLLNQGKPHFFVYTK